MLIRQFVDEGLGNSSYLIASDETGLAAVVDPERDVDRYVQVAEGLGLRVSYALETHLHNDFVSGTRELAARLSRGHDGGGLRICASARAGLSFDHLPLKDGDSFPLGELTIGVLATPGHTPEHISFTLAGAGATDPAAIFTGGSLIVGGAARTDLLGAERAEPLAGELYHTIHDRLLHFPDEVLIYPTHGAGSFCAAPGSADRTSTLGRERQANPLAAARSEEEFVALALSNLPSYPTYFKYMRSVNRRGPQILGGIPVLEPLGPMVVREHVARGVAVVDVRTPREFMAGHIPGAYGIPLGAPLITWAGWVVPFGTPIVLVADSQAEREEAVRQLIRIGYDDLRGYLTAGLAAWEGAGFHVARVPLMQAEELHRELERGDAPAILDVRQDAEWRAGHLPRAIHVEAGRLPTQALPLPQDGPIVVHCGHADRSTVGISVLERRGYRNLVLLDGGFSGWKAGGFQTVRE